MQENENTKKIKKPKNIKNIILITIQAVIIAICLFGAIFIMVQNKASVKDPKKFNANMMVVVTDSMEPTINTKSMIFSDKFESDEILDIGTVVTYYVKKEKGDFITITHRIVGYYYNNKSANTSFKVYGNKDLKSFEDLKNKFNSDELIFVGYLTRGDKYTFEYGASLDDFKILNNENEIDYSKDDKYYSYLTNDLILAKWSGKQSEFLGRLVTFLSQPNHLMLCIVLPIILLIVYNMVVVLKEIVGDKKLKAKEEALNEYQIDEEEIKRKAIEEYLANQKEKE